MNFKVFIINENSKKKKIRTSMIINSSRDARTTLILTLIL